MTIPELFLLEFDEEMPGTRRILERVPEASFSWQPHEKSMTLGRLASHLADLPQRCTAIITSEELVRPLGFTPFLAGSSQELLERFDTVTADARTALAGLREDQLSVIWSIKMGDRTIASLPRAMALRRVFMNHHIHHRAQLGVYLRLLNIPIPGMYGPSADDQKM
ncbi:MAG: DinB family protein [Acidobacteriaceae bacterium]